MKIRLLHLVERLLIDNLIILAGTAPFLYEWAKRLKQKCPIFVKSFSFWRPCSILQSIAFRLHLVAPMLLEESW